MHSIRRRIASARMTSALILLASAPNAALAIGMYQVAPLSGMSLATGITQSANVSGVIPGSQAAYWDGTAPVPLGTLGGPSSVANAINNAGLVVGQSLTAAGSAGDYRAFVFDGVAMEELGNLGGRLDDARSINDAGVIVGRPALPGITGYSHAVRWVNGVPFDLGTLGGTVSEALDINNAGQIVGWARTPTIASRAALWQNGTVTDLGTLGGATSRANAINDAGQIVGRANTTITVHACLWDGGGAIDLGTLGGQTSEAFDINASGQIVGVSQMPPSTPGGGFLWEDGTMYSLTDFLIPEDAGWSISNAVAINDQGWIAGFGRLGTGAGVPVLLRPVGTVAVGDPGRAPGELALSGRSGRAAALVLSLPGHAHVKLHLFDVTGRMVAHLHDGSLTAGTHSFALAASRQAAGLASGVYFARATVQGGGYAPDHRTAKVVVQR